MAIRIVFPTPPRYLQLGTPGTFVTTTILSPLHLSCKLMAANTIAKLVHTPLKYVLTGPLIELRKEHPCCTLQVRRVSPRS
jgi:hypothetical protein